MKVTIIEGTPEELANYEERTGLIGQAQPGDLTAGAAGRPAGTAGSEEAMIWSFIAGRAREPRIAAQVEAYLRRVLELGTEVEIGTSKTSRDGRGDSLLVYDQDRWYGAVAYVNAKNAGLTVRLTREDVSDLTDPHVKFRSVKPGNQYQVNCPIAKPDAIDSAVLLTKRALDKVRQLRQGPSPDPR